MKYLIFITPLLFVFSFNAQASCDGFFKDGNNKDVFTFSSEISEKKMNIFRGQAIESFSEIFPGQTVSEGSLELYKVPTSLSSSLMMMTSRIGSKSVTKSEEHLPEHIIIYKQAISLELIKGTWESLNFYWGVSSQSPNKRRLYTKHYDRDGGFTYSTHPGFLARYNDNTSAKDLQTIQEKLVSVFGKSSVNHSPRMKIFSLDVDALTQPLLEKFISEYNSWMSEHFQFVDLDQYASIDM